MAKTPQKQSSGLLAPSPPTLAIEIAVGRVTVAELSGGATPHVGAYASESLPADAVKPALHGTNIPKPSVVADVLRAALDRAGLRAAKRAALVIPDSVARVSLIRLEQVPARAADLDKLLRWQLKKSSTFPIEEAQLGHFQASHDGTTATIAAVVAHRPVISEYESVAAALGIHAGLVDLASFNVMNAVMGAGAGTGDSLLVCMAVEGTTLAILRGDQLMFYRHRSAVDDEPLGALVHQTAMYYEDMLGGSKFSHIWLAGSSLMQGGEAAKAEFSQRLGVAAETVDIRTRAPINSTSGVPPALLDALAAPVGVLLRERKAA